MDAAVIWLSGRLLTVQESTLSYSTEIMDMRVANRFAKDGITVHDDDPSIHMDEVESVDFLDSPTTYLNANGEVLLGALKVRLAEEKRRRKKEGGRGRRRRGRGRGRRRRV